jgi:hypothetical protein
MERSLLLAFTYRFGGEAAGRRDGPERRVDAQGVQTVGVLDSAGTCKSFRFSKAWWPLSCPKKLPLGV